MKPIKRIRKHVFKISQAELAKVAGVTQATVSRWEAGEFGPNIGEMTRIRDEAIARSLKWDDALFFDDGGCGPEQGAAA